MKLKYLIMVFGIAAFTAMSCSNPQADKDDQETDTTEEKAKRTIVYSAEITPLNSDITGLETHGKASFAIQEEEMVVKIEISDAPPEMQHWQHFHGFIDGVDAGCATLDLDENGDGIVDVVETELVSGTTMVPFNDIPSDIKLGENTYPIADETGYYSYEKVIKMSDLERKFAEVFDGGDINLDRRVLYIHGIPEDTELPESVQSVHDIPAHITLPIACGKIVRVTE